MDQTPELVFLPVLLHCVPPRGQVAQFSTLLPSMLLALVKDEAMER